MSENKKITNKKIISFFNEKENLDKNLYEQIMNLTNYNCINKVVLLPDTHLGHFFPVGSAVSVDLSEENALIFPAGIGYDINCGMRMSKCNLFLNDIKNHLSVFADKIFEKISVGNEKEISLRKDPSEKLKRENINLKDLNGILDCGMKYLIERNILKEDLNKIENNGSLEGNSRLISQKAKGKGLTQVGTLGSGNHFIEIQVVDEVFCEESAYKIGLKKDQIVFSIHSGSRGLGYQIKSEFKDEIKFYSEEGKKYFSAMKSAANFAFVNRALMCKKVNEIIYELFGKESELIYDVSHNIITKEEINGKEYLIHRKGASRSIGKEVPFGLEGQPIPVGGSMGTASYLLLGAKESRNISLSSCCHGSGRIIPRKECINKFTLDDLKEEMGNIQVRFLSDNGLIEEIPSAYKNIDDVVFICEKENIAKRIVKVKPLIVIKG